MGVFRKTEPHHLIPVSPDNAASKDWVILLEAGTIVSPSPHRLRVASSTQEKKIVKRYNLFLRSRHFLDVEGYDPRIHAVYFCPQLYKYDPEKKLIPLQGEEVGRLIAQALAGGVKARRLGITIPEQFLLRADAVIERQRMSAFGGKALIQLNRCHVRF
jgi:hypothetical protein